MTAPAQSRLNVGRLGSTHLGYYSPLTVRHSFSGVTTYRVRIEGLSIREYQGGQPNTATMRVSGFIPTKGQTVRLGLGSLDPAQTLFNGRIQRITGVEEGAQHALAYDLECVGNEVRMNGIKVIGKQTGLSATDIVLWIMSFTTGFSTAGVEADLPVINEIQFTDVDVTDALDRVRDRIGGQWVLDDGDILHFGVAPFSGTTQSITNANRHGATIQGVSDDLGPVRTRIRGTGGGGQTLAEIEVGATIIPVIDIGWYDVAGGLVVMGPQRISYSGIAAGGAGSLIGTTIVPTNGPVVAPATGTGIESGSHSYKYTYLSAAGQTTPSPASATVVLGASITAPSSALTPTRTTGGSLSNGAYKWKTTFLDVIGGETTPSAESASVTMEGVAAPSSALTAAKAAGGSLSDGDYRWRVTFVTSVGETMPGNTSTPVTMDTVTPPTGIYSGSATPGSSGSIATGNYDYKLTFVTSAGETTGGTSMHQFYDVGQTSLALTGILTGPSGTTARKLYRTTVGPGATFKLVTTISGNASADFTDTLADASLGATIPGANTAVNHTGSLTGIPVSSDPTVTKRKVYRSAAGGGAGTTFKLVTTINDNTTTTYTDTTADGSRGADEPSSDTSGGYHSANLTGIPVSSDQLVVSRKVYRTAAAGSTFKLLTTLSDNTTTTFADGIADASLGSDAPSSNTTVHNRINVSAITVGPTGTVSRKLYRTKATDPATWQLLTTLSDNTTTTYADSTPDASLGAEPPTLDTSGLAVQVGEVAAGSTSIPVTSVAPFLTTGGWAFIGALAFQYTGVSATQLTGVPSSGIGMLSTTVKYAVEVIASPMLTGVPALGDGSVIYAAPKGEQVNVHVVVDDLTAQATMAAAVGGDGIVEDTVQDGRWSLRETQDRAMAKLQEVKDSLVTVRYTTRDLTTRAGREVSFSTSAPNVSGTQRIQSVTYTDFLGVGERPLRQVEASSRRLTFEGLLRKIKVSDQ